MTGEITLRGRVLPIGGLKEKTMAAYRSGIRTVIIPADNESDLAEIDKTVRNALEFVIASDANDVLKTAIDFSMLPSKAAKDDMVAEVADMPIDTGKIKERKVLQ